MAAPALHRALWGTHAALCWLFFGLIGATVLRHMVAAPVQLALRQLRVPGRLAPAAAEPASLEPQRLTWAQLLDAATCVRCGRCTAVCPATAAGKPLDPRRVVQATLQAMREGRALETVVTPEEAWSCTTCAACVRACPFEIEVLDKLVDLRRTLVEAGAVDPAATRALESTVERGNPFGGMPADRTAWAAGLGVRVLQPGEDDRYPLLGRLRRGVRSARTADRAGDRAAPHGGGRRVRRAGVRRELHRRPGAANR